MVNQVLLNTKKNRFNKECLLKMCLLPKNNKFFGNKKALRQNIIKVIKIFYKIWST